MGKIAFVFAGQGSQQVGMGRDLAEAHPEVRALYDRAGAVLGFDLARLSFEGPEESLKRTDVSQPAILAASLAALAVFALRRPETRPDFCAGLSLGEYGALVASGALEEETALRLVALRGRLMQEACEARPGAMASVLGAQPSEVEAVCASLSEPQAPLTVANYNGPRQVVISGAAEKVAAAEAPLRARGARRVIPLNVAGAYHSPLMASAAERLALELRRALDSGLIREPRVPVVANVTGEPERSAREVFENLAAQVVAPVRWTRTTEFLISEGVTDFYEFGPGGVLSGLVRQVAREARCVTLDSVAAFERAGLK